MQRSDPKRRAFQHPDSILGVHAIEVLEHSTFFRGWAWERFFLCGLADSILFWASLEAGDAQLQLHGCSLGPLFGLQAMVRESSNGVRQ